MTTKKKASRPPLVPLGDLLVLGGRYRYGRGMSWNKQPLMYISVPHRPGITVMADNLWAFHQKLGEMIEVGFPELRGEPPPKEVVEAEKAESEIVELPCPGPGSEDWRYINKIEGGLKEAPELFVTHPFKTAKEDGTICSFCTFDTARTSQYEDTAREIRLSEDGEEAGGTPPVRVDGRSAEFP